MARRRTFEGRRQFGLNWETMDVKRPLPHLTTTALIGLALLMSAGSDARAQTVDTESFLLFLESLESANTDTATNKHLSMFGVQTATTAPNGTGFASVTGSTPRGGIAGNGPDYEMALGFGLGDANETIGAQVTLNITGTQPFADTGYFSLKFSRAISTGPNPTYIGASFSRVAPWGNVAGGVSTTAMLTHFNSFSAGGETYPIMLTAGYGSDIAYTTSLPTTNSVEPGAFVGVGVGLTENFGVSASATRGTINLGVGMKVEGVDGLSLSAGVYDAFDQMNKRQASVTVSYTWADVFGGLR